MQREKVLPIDQGYAWVVVTAAFSLFAVSAGGFKCQGVLFVELLDRFDGVYEASTLLWVFTIASMLGCIFGFTASLIILKIGHRATMMIGLTSLALSFIGLAYAPNLPALFILHSIPAGFGSDTLVITSLLVSGPYFIKRKALAIGLIASGSGVGTLVLPNIMRLLFDSMDYSGALLLYAGFHLQFLVVASFLRPISYYENMHDSRLEEIEISEENSLGSKETSNKFDSPHKWESDSIYSTDESLKLQPDVAHIISVGELSAHIVIEDQQTRNNKLKDSNKETFNWKLILRPKFFMLLMSIAIFALGGSVIYACVPALGEESGISKETVALTLLGAGVLEIPCRIANGMIADKKIFSATAQYSMCLFGAGFLSLLCTIIDGLPGVALALVGMSSMGTSVFSLLPIVIKELVGKENITSGMGLMSIIKTTAFPFSTYVTGVMYDTTGTWRTPFYFISTTIMLGGVLIWPYLIMSHYRHKSSVTQESVSHESVRHNSTS